MCRRQCIQMLMVVLFLSIGFAQAQTSWTIYNRNFAVVRQPLLMDLKQGIGDYSITDITMHLEPDSVILRDPAGGEKTIAYRVHYSW
jgi:hypothetical protein